MEFKPMHAVDPWYSTPEAPVPHPGFERLKYTASVNFTDLASRPASWRPKVHFKYELEVDLTVGPPNYGTFTDLKDAEAWCQAVVGDVSFCRAILQVHANNLALTSGFKRGMLPTEDDDAQPNGS